MKISVFNIIILCMVCGCSFERASVRGVYSYNKYLEITYTLEIKKDSTFIFHWQNGLDNGITTGTYTAKRHSLILTSEKTGPDEILRVEEGFVDTDSSIFILMDTTATSIGLAGVIINDTIVLITNEEGRVALARDIPIKTVKVYYLNLPIPEYCIKNSSNNNFILTINANYHREIYFDNTRLRFTKRELIMQKGKISNRRIRLDKIEE